MWFYASLLSKFIGRIPLESLAGMKWNHRPESRGITGRNALEYAGCENFFRKVPVLHI